MNGNFLKRVICCSLFLFSLSNPLFSKTLLMVGQFNDKNESSLASVEVFDTLESQISEIFFDRGFIVFLERMPEPGSKVKELALKTNVDYGLLWTLEGLTLQGTLYIRQNDFFDESQISYDFKSLNEKNIKKEVLSFTDMIFNEIQD